MHNAVRVDIEGHFDLRHATRLLREVGQVELAERTVVAGKFAFALQHVNRHGRLVVFGGREHLALLGRNRGVTVDELGHHATESFDTQGKRGHVEEQHVLHGGVAAKHGTLDGGTDSHHFVRVHSLVRFLAEELLHGFLHGRDTGRTTDQDHFVDFAQGEAGVGDSLAAGFHGAFHQVGGQLVKLCTAEREVQMFRARSVGSDEGEVDVRGSRGRKVDLRLFRGVLQTLQGHLVLLQVDARIVLLEFVVDPVDNHFVEVVTAEHRIAVGGLHAEHAVVDFQDGDIERTATEVIHGDLFALLGVKTVGKGGCRRFVHDTQHFEASNLAGILRSLTLGVVKVGGDRNHGLRHRLAQVVFGNLLHGLENHGRNLGRSELLVVHLHAHRVRTRAHQLVGHVLFGSGAFAGRTAHETLDGVNRLFGVGDGLTLCHVAHQTFAVLAESDNGRGGAETFRVSDDDRLAAFHHGHAAVGRSQVNTDNLAHNESPIFKFLPPANQSERGDFLRPYISKTRAKC